MSSCSLPPLPGMNGAKLLAYGPVAERSPRAEGPGTVASTEAGKSTVLVGTPVFGRVTPATRAKCTPMFACLEESLTIGWMLCPPFFVENDRTTTSLCASFASCPIVAPKRTPGSEVGTTSPTVRMPLGASGFGSNVSNWLGPPC